MPTEIIDVTTSRGTMPVHLSRPGDHADAPLVVIYMDSLGIRGVLHDHARRLNAAGYATALPDLFFEAAPADLPRIDRLRAGEEEEFRRMGALVATLDDHAILDDTERLLKALGINGAWGSVGFCMGGRCALRAAEAFSDQVAAASLLHPSRLVTDAPDSPHRAVERIRGGLYLGLGENDHVTPPASLEPLREELERHGIDHRIEVLPGADHGFTMPGMPAYNKEAAERAWAGTLDLLGERLGAGR